MPEPKSSKVFFAGAKAKNYKLWWDPSSSMLAKLERVFFAGGMDKICKGKVGIKMHFGEPGNTHYIRPAYAGRLVELIKKSGGKPVFIETSGLGSLAGRTTAKLHLEAARKNGFTKETVGAEIVMIDGDDGLAAINEKTFVAKGIKELDSVVVLSHLTAHIQAGFGGAIKNIALGCVNKLGKYNVHYTGAPCIDKSLCNKCDACLEVCPVEGAIADYEITSTCMPCGFCIDACSEGAVKASWRSAKELSLQIAENAAEVLKYAKKTACITLAIDILPHCDCHPFSDVPFAPDIGILASHDIVAIDRASIDIIGIERLKKLNPQTSPELQLKRAEELGIGSQKYEMTKVE